MAARITKLARTAGLKTSVTPHGLRRTFCTAGLIAGVPLRDMQHAAHPVAAYLAGMASG